MDETRVPHLKSEGVETGGEIPLRFTIENPWIINSWRIGAFFDAAGAKLPDVLSQEDWYKWRGACVVAAHMSNRGYNEFSSYGGVLPQTRTVLDEEGAVKFPDDVKELIRLIGKDEFDKLYNSPPPPEVVDYMLSDEYLYGHTFTMPQLEELTIEVMRGRLQWDQRLDAAGVPTPDEFRENPDIVVGKKFDMSKLNAERQKRLAERRSNREAA